MENISLKPQVAETFAQLWEEYTPERSLRDNLVAMLKNRGIESAEATASKLILGINNCDKIKLNNYNLEELNTMFAQKVREMLRDKKDADAILLDILSKLAASDETTLEYLATTAPATGEMDKAWNNAYEKRKATLTEAYKQLSPAERAEELSKLLNDNSAAMAKKYLFPRLSNASVWDCDFCSKYTGQRLLQTVHDRNTAKCLYAATQLINQCSGKECDLPSGMSDPYAIGVIASASVSLIEEACESCDDKETDYETFMRRLAAALMLVALALISAGLFALVVIAPPAIFMIAFPLLVGSIAFILTDWEIRQKWHRLSQQFSVWMSIKKNASSRILRELLGGVDRKHFNNNVVPCKESQKTKAEA